MLVNAILLSRSIQYAYHDSVSKNLLILIILQILKLLSLKLIMDPQLLIEQEGS